MAELLSVGLDVGTTTTQLIVSRLTVENRASAFSVPELRISRREILYQSPVHFTPLLREQLVDGEALRQTVLREYANAGIRREQVDTGAIIITGETSRKENARQVLQALSDLAGEFVVTTAGPHLESVLAARGAGAVEASGQTGRPILHIDIGGGTSNLALLQDGKVLRTGCLNVGGRLIKLDSRGTVTYISPVLEGIFLGAVGQIPSEDELKTLAGTLTEALEMAAGLRPATQLLDRLSTAEAGSPWQPPEPGAVISFSGGVAQCIRAPAPPLAFGDLGPILGNAIRESRLCQADHRIGSDPIRATVIGAGCHSTQLSGSTIYHRGIVFPLKNLQVVTDPEMLKQLDAPGILALPNTFDPDYRQIRDLAHRLAADRQAGPLLIAAEADMAKALGHALALLLPPDVPVLCIDRVQLQPGSYLDVGAPVGSALPVVVKTLILNR